MFFRLQRSKLSAATLELIANEEAKVGTIYIDGRPAKHMVDQVTHFCSASFFRCQSENRGWKTNKKLSFLVYFGSSDHFVVH